MDSDQGVESGLVVAAARDALVAVDLNISDLHGDCWGVGVHGPTSTEPNSYHMIPGAAGSVPTPPRRAPDLFFFFDSGTIELYTLSIHEALPISNLFHYLDSP